VWVKTVRFEHDLVVVFVALRLKRLACPLREAALCGADRECSWHAKAEVPRVEVLRCDGREGLQDHPVSVVVSACIDE
jgi:hypothetical protein